MNINKELNKIVSFVEEHIFEDIDIKKLGKMVGMTGYVLGYIWSAITGMSLSTYIRNRRLTLAYNLLKENKVIDVAFMCGYTSAQSFSRAFKDFHGFSPSQSKGVHSFSVQCKLNFDENKEESNFKAEFIHLKKQTFYGEKMHLSFQDKINKKIKFFWQKQLDKNPLLQQADERYGVVIYCNDGFDYYIALKTPYCENCQPVEVEENDFVKVKVSNYIAMKIDDYSNDVKTQFCQNQTSPDIEIYKGNDVELLFGIN